jgi:hypothetical protein
MNRRIAILSFGLALVLTASASAQSAKHPPGAVLRKGNETIQRGRQGSYCWSWSTPDGGGGAECGDVLGYDFPDAVKVRVHSRLAIRFRKADRPERVSVLTWKALRDDGSPRGSARRIPIRLKAVKREGELRAWDAVLRLQRSGRHYYIEAFGEWGEGSAWYWFHART